MHSTSPALVEALDYQTAHLSDTIPPVYPVQSVQLARQTPARPSRSGRNAYHFIMLTNQDECPAWHVVNGRGVPDDTLTAFAHHLASSIGVEQARATLAPLLSYLTEQARHDLLWYAPAGCLQEAWQNYLRQYAPCWEMSGGKVTVLEVTAGQRRDLHALQALLAQFYTFAIARAIYGYQHPFAGQRRFICLSIPSQLRGLLSPWLHTSPSHR